MLTTVTAMTKTIAVIGGDYIGPEVTAEAVKVLDAVVDPADVVFEKTYFELGAARYLATGDVLTDDDLEAISEHDAILLGAVGGKPGDPRLAGANIERGLLLKLRFALDHYVNLRPTVILPGVTSPLSDPGDVDFVVVREGTEGPYVGNGGAIRVGTPNEIANEVSVNTAFGVERVVRYAFDQAEKPIAAVCHGAQLLAAAGVLKGRRVSAYPACRPEVELAGGDYADIAIDDAVTDGHLITAPAWPAHPAWLSRFIAALGTRIEL